MPSDTRCLKANCGGLVEAHIGAFGQVAYRCARCERKKARLCRDCSARTPSSHCWRCPSCALKHRRAFERERDRERYATRRRQVLANHAKRRTDPVVRAHRKAYMAAYRIKNPRDHHDRAYGREYMRACRADPKYRAREQRRKRRLRRESRIAA